MPIFSKKFYIKTIPPRAKRHPSGPQVQEKLIDIQTLQINLNKKKLKFVDGSWLVSNQCGDMDDISVIKKKIQKLEEENNLKQVKIDILLDMLSENLAELNVIRK